MNTSKTIRSLGLAVFLLIACSKGFHAGGTQQKNEIPDKQNQPFYVAPPQMPKKDLSGEIGKRILTLLSIQAERNLKNKEYFKNGKVFPGNTVFTKYFLGGCANMFSVLVRYGKPGETMAGTTRKKLQALTVSCLETVAQTHPLGSGKKPWSKSETGRTVYKLGMGAWLNWTHLSPQTQKLIGRIMAAEANRFIDAPVPSGLRGNSLADSNAWNGGGLAVAACMFKNHPNAVKWAQKAHAYMIGAYATASDIKENRQVMGKPLSEWIETPNALSDHTVEKQGFVHPDYMAAISEMFRSTLAFRFAGDPVPESSTFNGEQVFDRLMYLTLPDGSHFYPQGTYYTPRRIDSFFQVCSMAALKHHPRRKAALIRSIENLENMAREWPDLPMHAWLGLPVDLGCTWGLTQNYLACRFFGTGDKALRDEELESSLAGVHKSDQGRFVMHRTKNSLSSFSWHPKALMGMTMPLDRDVMVYPMPLSAVGEVYEQVPNSKKDAPFSFKSKSLAVSKMERGLGALVRIEMCRGKVKQHSAFISLPDGNSVYLSQRTAVQKVKLGTSANGSVTVIDDSRLPYQGEARQFFIAGGQVEPNAQKTFRTHWVNVDGRMGYAVLGGNALKLNPVKGKPRIRRGTGTMYHTVRLSFVDHKPGTRFDAGEPMGSFAMVSCPNQDQKATAQLSTAIQKEGWAANQNGFLALRAGNYLVLANFTEKEKSIRVKDRIWGVSPFTASWLDLNQRD